MSRPVPNPHPFDAPEWTETFHRSLSEEDSHREHRAALDATVFAGCAARDEVVFELEDGELRPGLRRS